MSDSIEKKRMDWVRPNVYNELDDDVKSILLRSKDRRFI